jgi:DNA-binding transcriptional LysR family regulator
MSLGDVRLRAFALVLDLGSVSAAADVLGYTQSAVSQQLAALEREVGAPLVDRTQRPLRPTAAGAALRPHAERILAELGRAEAAVDALRGGSPRIRLAAFHSALSSFVPAAVRDLRRAHDDLVVEVLQLETHEAVEWLRSGQADLAVVHLMPGVAVPDTAGLQRRRLLTDHLYAVLPERHRLAHRDALDFADLESEPMILPRRGTAAGRFRAVVELLCAQAGFAPRVAYELEDLPAVQAFVSAGIAVVPMHGLTLATLPRGVVARPLGDPTAGSRTIEALAPAAVAPAAEDFLDRLARAATSWRPGPASRS